jgi:histidine decarboxylase
MLLNNVGDPFDQAGYWKSHTKFFECEVIRFFGNLFQFKDVWGYVTSGGTEGNLEGLYVGRNYLKAKYHHDPKAFYSIASHYSIKKNIDVINVPSAAMPVNEKDEIDLNALKEAIRETPSDIPILINANIGTTMKGAVDDLKGIVAVLKELNRNDYYIHADMALYGLIYRFFGDFDETFVQHVSSFAISGHKLLTQSFPSGIFVGHKNRIDVGFDTKWVSYIGAPDNTISGSRNGLLPLLIHAKISKGEDFLRDQVRCCLEVCQHLYSQMNDVLHYPCHRSTDYAIIVYFQKPPEEICVKYQLACHDDFAHIVCMPHINKEMIDRFIDDLRACQK